MASWTEHGTINPADLNSSPADHGVTPSANSLDDVRGVKRSRSAEEAEDAQGEYNTSNQDGSKPRKRGRPFKSKLPDSPELKQSTPAPKAETPAPNPQNPSKASPTQATPPKSTPNGKGVKSLPTVRDHTSDQLNDEGDEYVPREFDEAGEAKVDVTGHPQDGREYRCRTFTVPNRGDKLFMLATECARVLVYRDSYLLFNKNKSLFKIIASQKEKDDLIAKEILPYSYRSRQIAMVSAKSMYRQFGARMIQGGRRVRDDYWEQKARKQGFTEDDLASEKRPAANKPKEPIPDGGQANANAMSILAGNQIIYQDLPGHDIFSHLPGAGLGIGDIAPAMTPMSKGGDLSQDYGHFSRPRQDITGTPYHDRTQSSSTGEIVSQATQANDFNRSITGQRDIRARFLRESWNREHKAVTPPPSSPPAALVDAQLAGNLGLNGDVTSPDLRNHPATNTSSGQRPQSLHMQANRHSSGQMNSAGLYHQQATPQAPHTPGHRMHPSLQGSSAHVSTPARTPVNYPYGLNSAGLGSAGMGPQQPQHPHHQQMHNRQPSQPHQTPQQQHQSIPPAGASLYPQMQDNPNASFWSQQQQHHQRVQQMQQMQLAQQQREQMQQLQAHNSQHSPYGNNTDPSHMQMQNHPMHHSNQPDSMDPSLSQRHRAGLMGQGHSSPHSREHGLESMGLAPSTGLQPSGSGQMSRNAMHVAAQQQQAQAARYAQAQAQMAGAGGGGPGTGAAASMYSPPGQGQGQMSMGNFMGGAYSSASAGPGGGGYGYASGI